MASYLNVISSFVCMEDVWINVDSFKLYLYARQVRDTANLGIGYYLGALRNVSGVTLNVMQLTDLLSLYFGKDEAGKVQWPNGTLCGCCGNYNAPCAKWNQACLAHDMLCQTCFNVYVCFYDCVPTSCQGNTIPWWWMIIPN
ncbi:MAG: hypothetical protein WKF88_09150 [Ferruginibacter sp.]